jgi:hypothetical protein
MLRLIVIFLSTLLLHAPLHGQTPQSMESPQLPANTGANPGAIPLEAPLANPTVNPSTSLEEPVRRFLEAFIDPDQSPEFQATYFEEGANYYRFGPTSRKEIAKDIRRYVRHWPERSYTLSHIEYIRPDPDSGDVFVSYVLDYEVSSGSRSARGSASYGAIISNLHSDPKISMIMEKVGGKSSGQ